MYSEIELKLARLEKAVPDDRKEYIRDLEAEGWEISYNGCYRARRGNERYSVPNRQCEQCGEERYLHLFLGRGLSLMPWCKSCRNEDPKGAKRAADRQRAKEKYDALSPDEKREIDRNQQKQKREKAKAEKAARHIAHQLAMTAIEQVDLSDYSATERRMIRSELTAIRKNL